MLRQSLLVHGVKFSLETNCEKVWADFTHDFAYFITNRPNSFDDGAFVLRHTQTGSPNAFARVSSTLRRSQHFWTLGNRRRLCMLGEAMVDYNFSRKFCNIRCGSADISYEAVYLVTLSYIGEALDRKGLHRIHGLGFVSKGQAGILLSPSGGGKSTLAMQLLKEPTNFILSDDTPIIGKAGQMLAFPQRIALKLCPQIPDNYIRKFKRLHYGEKYVVGADFFGKAIINEAKINWLIISDKTKHEEASCYRVSRLKLIWPLIKWLVIGYETPQIWELYLRPSGYDLFSKLKILLSRLDTACRLLFTEKVAQFRFSKDAAKSAAVFEDFFEAEKKGKGMGWNFQYTS